MAKKKAKAARARKNEANTQETARNAAQPPAAVIQNGLMDGFGGLQVFGAGPSAQLSQVDTLFQNNRWYMVSNSRQLLSEIYVEHGLVQTIVDVPVDDGLRGGVEIKSRQLSPEQVEELQIHLDRQNVIPDVVGQAHKWNRLFGGAGVVILTDQDPATPLDVELLTEEANLDFRAIDLWELYFSPDTSAEESAKVLELAPRLYNYYGRALHPSRVIRMRGSPAPSFVRGRLRGWGFSVVESLVRSINQYLKSNNLAFEVLDEFKVDVFKIKNYTQTLLSSEGMAKAQRRVDFANQQKNFQNALCMDTEDDFLQKQITFSGLADVMREIRMQIASDMRMPLTKIFGISAAGFSSGEDDIENYNAMVESQVRSKAKHEILRLLELICQQKYGFIPDDLAVGFKPLRVLSSVDEETVKTQKFTRLLQARAAGELDPKEFRDACNRDNLLGIQLDTSDETIEALKEQAPDRSGDGLPEPDIGDEAGTEPEAPDAPGATIQ